MSYASYEIVKEFFILNGFFVLKEKDVFIIKNTDGKIHITSDFVLEKERVLLIKNGVVKPISWHTLKFTPSVLNKFPEIFDFVEKPFIDKIKKYFAEEPFLKILIIPALPVSENLRRESIKILKEKGIDHVILFPTIIAGLLEKIEPRHVYLSSTSEVFRILKFYKFISEREQHLPFKKKK